AVVCADCGSTPVRDDRYPRHPGISCAQMGVRAGDGVHRGDRCIPLRPRLPRTAARLHERYVAARWRQALGSTMHCIAGDGVGILAGAVLANALGLGGLAEVILEYTLGFAFGWAIFQALFMRDIAGGSYRLSLARTFVPELLSMNLLMAGMVPTVMIL